MANRTILPRSFHSETIKLQYARVAWFYDFWSQITEDKALKRLVAMVGIHEGSNLLEVGVGTGRLFAKLALLNSSGRNEGVDLSPEMLRHARRRLSRVSLTGTFQLQEASAYDLPFEPESFEIVFNTFMLDLIPEEDFDRVFCEFKRVLKPNGILALAYFSQGRKKVNAVWSWTAKHFPSLLTGCRPIQIEPQLRKAGFNILHLEEISQNTFPSAVMIATKES